MKVHYINILLFALPLNILAHNEYIPHTTPNHTHTNRSLCECDLYMPNYDTDPQMKEVMDNFNKQTQQRFHEYDERMVEKRKQCKDKFDKEIQKIILKDKLEKELTEKLSTLQTDIQSDAIPTCICEKSIADKTEKFCLNCGKTMGGVAPGWGLLCGVGYAGWAHYVPQIAMQKGIEEGVKWGIQGLTDFPGLRNLIPISEIKNLINPTNYTDSITYVSFVEVANKTNCVARPTSNEIFCNLASNSGEQILAKRASGIAKNAARMAKITEKGVLKEGASATSSLTTAIISSVVAIVVIVLIMVIIYLILRYRRKKKVKKKLQYIKLLEE
ncbi:rifin PIR protein, putative [Plasmodium reichenowi]|uniref:Rifin PIR protein, putative n=1 Tax=Plasmodium reichenowi TaxID=5854 RepID=A0A2P9DSP2_PLARE|nr:rifin PIR protein, putative [Plasmodium reichenowi]